MVTVRSPAASALGLGDIPRENDLTAGPGKGTGKGTGKVKGTIRVVDLPDPERRRIERHTILWRTAREDAELVVHQAETFWQEIRAIHPILDVGRSELITRLQDGLRRARRHHEAQYGRGGDVGAIAYIGTTSCPTWRWAGGFSWRDGAHRPEWMIGHKAKWNHLLVLGSWPDRETAKVEKEAIEWALPTGLLTNRVADARGLSARPFAYSFLYICY